VQSTQPPPRQACSGRVISAEFRRLTIGSFVGGAFSGACLQTGAICGCDAIVIGVIAILRVTHFPICLRTPSATRQKRPCKNRKGAGITASVAQESARARRVLRHGEYHRVQECNVTYMPQLDASQILMNIMVPHSSVNPHEWLRATLPSYRTDQQCRGRVIVLIAPGHRSKGCRSAEADKPAWTPSQPHGKFDRYEPRPSVDDMAAHT
jgi:hypothetical protein